jgi:hypothetical protein
MARHAAVVDPEIAPGELLEQQTKLVEVLVLLGLGSVLPMVDGTPAVLGSPPRSKSGDDANTSQ